MATKYQMQGVTGGGALISWRAAAPDWSGSLAPGGGGVTDVALSSGGFLTSSAAPSTYQVTVGGVGVTAGGVEVDVTSVLVTVGGVQVQAGGVDVTA